MSSCRGQGDSAETPEWPASGRGGVGSARGLWAPCFCHPRLVGGPAPRARPSACSGAVVGASREGLRPLCPVPATVGGATAFTTPSSPSGLLGVGRAAGRPDPTPGRWRWGPEPVPRVCISRCRGPQGPLPEPGAHEACAGLRRGAWAEPHAPLTLPRQPQAGSGGGGGARRAGKQTGRTSREQEGAPRRGGRTPRPRTRQRKVQNTSDVCVFSVSAAR